LPQASLSSSWCWGSTC